MAKIIEEEMGEKLWIPPGTDTCMTQWPSPASLKQRIIIRDKLVHKQDTKIGPAAEALPALAPAPAAASTAADFLPIVHPPSTATAAVEDDDDEDADDSESFRQHDPAASPPNSPRSSLRAPTPVPGETSLRSLVTIENAKFKTFQDAASLARVFSCSWAEGKLLSRVAGTDAAVMLAFTSRHLLRCYPAGHRVMSDNCDPSTAWSVGAQMVALNFQANDKPTWMNRGKFSANGGCGYIRKPVYLASPAPPGPSAAASRSESLEITIVAGSGWENFKDADLFDAPDTYIRVAITGNVTDAQSCATAVFNDHERTGPKAQPHFNESFSFTIDEPELALLLITVYDKDTGTQDDFLAQYCCPISTLRSGARIVPLYDGKGKYAGSDKQNACLVVTSSRKQHVAPDQVILDHQHVSTA